MSIVKANQGENFDAESAVADLDRKLARLRVLYEQYFLGIEKRPPNTPLKQVVRLIQVIEQAPMKNTAIKFRFRSLVQKFHSYRSYWGRTCREIENGTYRRHIQKVRNKEKRRQDLDKTLQDELAAIDKELAALGVEVPKPDEPGAPRVGEHIPNALAAEMGDLADDFLNSLGMGPTTPTAAPAAAQPPSRASAAPIPAATAAPTAPVSSSRPPPVIRGVQAEKVEKRASALLKLKQRLGPRGLPLRRPARDDAAASGETKGATPAATSSGTARRPPRTIERVPRSKPSTPARSASPAGGRNMDDTTRRSLTGAGISEQRLKTIYNSLVDAKKRCNQPTSNLSYDGLARSIAKQAPALQKKSGGGKVDFQVVIKKGKAYLKPVTDKESGG